jgi:hypothetical protein
MRKILILLVIIIVCVILTYGWWTYTQTKPVKVTREEAAEIIVSYAEEIWDLTNKSKGLRVNLYQQLLPKGTRVEPASFVEANEPPEIICENQCWLFLVDEDPFAHFAHPVQIVLLDAVTQEKEVVRAEWWPLIDGEPVFSTIGKRTENKTIIFYESPVFEYEVIDGGKITKLEILPCGPSSTCEAWAIIVCGYDDLPDTFDEDTDGIYSILRDLHIPDDHIFFTSPHTTHSGVDRDTSIANVQWAIGQVAAQADDSDRVLFFYSSHGGTDSLSCVPGDPNGGYITAANLDSWLDTITCDELCIVIEACHSGSLIGRYADGTYIAGEDDLTGDGENNRVIFTSASTDTNSYPDVDGSDDPNPGDSGSETIWGYVEAFIAISADTNGDMDISFDEAWQYAWDNDVTRLRGLNTPQMVHTGLNTNDVYSYCFCIEDCISFNYQNAEVKKIDGRWKIVVGDMWLLDFGSSETEANKALSIIKHYHMNEQCFVGRPDPSMEYFLVDGQAPSGTFSGEDCISFDPVKIEVKKIDGSWKIVENNLWILDFGDREGEARKALKIIVEYGFDYICYVGRPDPSMIYFRS